MWVNNSKTTYCGACMATSSILNGGTCRSTTLTEHTAAETVIIGTIYSGGNRSVRGHSTHYANTRKCHRTHTFAYLVACEHGNVLNFKFQKTGSAGITLLQLCLHPRLEQPHIPSQASLCFYLVVTVVFFFPRNQATRINFNS
jgi:hypothetical protein